MCWHLIYIFSLKIHPQNSWRQWYLSILIFKMRRLKENWVICPQVLKLADDVARTEPGPCGTIAWSITYWAGLHSLNPKLHQHSLEPIFRKLFLLSLLSRNTLALKSQQETILLSDAPPQNYKCRNVWKWSLNPPRQGNVSITTGFASFQDVD